MLLAVSAMAANNQITFQAHTIATDLSGGYQVVAIDMNKDGKPDLIALATGMKELVWFENPTWKRHVIAEDLPRMINLAAMDLDGDGTPEIILAYEFAKVAKNSLGIIALLSHREDPNDLWQVTEIDRVPTSHRLRWADIDGKGKKVIVNAPLTGLKAEPPDYRDHTPLLYYTTDQWMRQTISEENQGVVHGIYVIDWDGDGREDILTAGFEGINLCRRGVGGAWVRDEIAKGDPAPWPKSGSSDVAVGHLGKTRFLCAIEPWHGNQLVVYHDDKGKWQRMVIDAGLVDGHTILTADLNGDGQDEIIAGFRGQGHGVNVYYANDAKGSKWNKQVLDNGIAAAGCAVADLNGDGRPDIACIGSVTTNLKWYENKPPEK
jgi:hypothetical protein